MDREVNEDLQTALNKFKTVFMLAGDAMFILRQEDGLILEANSAAEELYGYTLSEFKEMKSTDLSAEVEKSNQARTSGSRFAALRYHKKKDGSILCVEIKANYYIENGEKLSVVNIRDITEQVISLEKETKNKEDYRSMFENFPALIWFSGLDKLCYYFNQTWLSFTGRTLEEEWGNGWAEGVHPDDFDRCLNIYVTNFDLRKQFYMEYRLKHHSGEYRWISDMGTPFYDLDGNFSGYIGSCYDISEQKNREIELIKFHTILEQIGTTIVLTDLKGNIEYVNTYALELSGYTKEELIGKSASAFKSGVHPKEFYTNLWKTILAGHIWQGKFTNVKKDGSLYEEQVIIAPIKNSHGEIVNFVAIKQDISDVAKLEQKLRQSQKMESIGVLAAGIAHEINSPMQYILDNTRFLQDSVNSVSKLVLAFKHTCLNKDNPECLSIQKAIADLDIDFVINEIPVAISETISGIDKIKKIVSALKDYSFPRGKVCKEYNISQLIDNILIITASHWKQYAEIDKRYDDSLTAIPCYGDEINQVLINLIVNAVDAIKSAKRESGKIVISTSKKDGAVYISVRDNGTGISPEMKDKIFDPFFTTKDVGEGTGQGLAIVYDIIVNLHNSDIMVNSEVGEGSEFVIKLPLNL